MISLKLGWLNLFLVGTDLFVISPLLPRIGHDLNIAPSSTGWMVTAFALAYVFGGPRLGALADRVGPRTVLASALAVFAAANAFTAAAPGFAVLLIARAFAGFAASGVTPSVYGMVGTAAPPGQRATWLSIVTSGLLLALATGAPAGSLAAGLVGWRGVFLVLSGVSVVVLAANLLTARAGARQEPQARSPRQVVPVVVRVRAVSVTGLWALAVYGVYTFLGTGLRHSAHFGSGLLAVSFAVYGAAAVVGNLSGGPLADRHGGRRVTTVSLAVLAVVEAVLALLVGHGAVLIAGLAAFALVAYPYFSAHQTRLVASFGDHAASLMAWNNTAMYVGILIGSAAGGAILAAAGFRALIEAGAAVALLGAFATLWAIAPDHAPAPPEQVERASTPGST
jgi:predicted MFS family arabinose efflux permease